MHLRSQCQSLVLMQPFCYWFVILFRLGQVIHSRKFLRSGTVVGSFKIDLKTVYDTLGTYINEHIDSLFCISYNVIWIDILLHLSLYHMRWNENAIWYDLYIPFLPSRLVSLYLSSPFRISPSFYISSFASGKFTYVCEHEHICVFMQSTMVQSYIGIHYFRLVSIQLFAWLSQLQLTSTLITWINICARKMQSSDDKCAPEKAIFNHGVGLRFVNIH